MASKNNEKSTENDLLPAIYQIAEERGLSQEMVLDQVKKAYLTAYKKMVREEEMSEEESSALNVDIEMETGEIIVLADKKVVSKVTDINTQILEREAKLIDTRLREGDHIQIDVTPENFGRIAAQAALQRLMQGLRDAELDMVTSKYTDKVGKIISGTIQRRDPNYVRVEVERAEAIMPLSEQIPGEYYRSSERKRFLLLKLQNSITDRRMVLSRGAGDFLKALLEVEVPEVATGSVEVVNIAREPGSRAKVAVRSLHEKVDAIGACVGPRGTRIESIMGEVSPEKVDIIPWDADISKYIINSLSPAKVVDISTDKKEGYAKILVAEDMLSLAIGKDGQNVRLAAKLTGYKIDITGNKELFAKEGRLNADKSDVVSEEKVPFVVAEDEIHPSEMVEEVLSEERLANPDELDSINLTSRQIELLKENGILTMNQILEVAKGEVEIKGFTKRDLEKIKSQVGVE